MLSFTKYLDNLINIVIMLPKIKLLAYKQKVYRSHKFEFLGFDVMLSFNFSSKLKLLDNDEYIVEIAFY